jgi:hypothetical protein
MLKYKTRCRNRERHYLATSTRYWSLDRKTRPRCKLALAKAYFEQARNIDENTYGPDRPSTKIVKGNLESLG